MSQKQIKEQTQEQPTILNTTINTARAPDFKSDGVAVWINHKEGSPDYLSIKIVGHATIYATRINP